MVDKNLAEQDNKVTIAFENIRNICQDYLEHYYSCAPDPQEFANAILEALKQAKLLSSE